MHELRVAIVSGRMGVVAAGVRWVIASGLGHGTLVCAGPSGRAV